MQENYDVTIIGAGPAGIMAAITIKEKNKDIRVAIVEKNDEIGRKLKITGGGRCNLTGNMDIDQFKEHVPQNPKFLYKSFKNFTNIDLMSFFEKEGLTFYSEGTKIFPKSNKSIDIINVLYKKLKENKVDLFLNESFIDFEGEDCFSVKTTDKLIKTKVLLFATGGASYKNTGSDGYATKVLSEKKIKVNALLPSLVKIDLLNENMKKFKGISLSGAKISIFEKNKLLVEKSGELVFTHTGIGGPLAINISSYISGKDFVNIEMYLDMIEELSFDFIAKILKNKKTKNIVSILSEYIPKNILKEIYFDCMDIDFNNIKKDELKNIIDRIKNVKLSIKSLGRIDEARVTRGGIDVKEINPSTMEIKKMPNIFVAGEIIDVDGLTGGYNLQIAFSTGYVAGESIAEKFKE